MSDAPATSPEFPPLGCSAIVYRALLRSSLIDKITGRISAGAFMRRAKDVDGLSVYVSANYSKRQIVLDFDPCHGIVSLHVGRIRDIGLDVQCDSLVHANIIGLPTEDNLLMAERFAGLLARQARLQWKRGDAAPDD